MSDKEYERMLWWWNLRSELWTAAKIGLLFGAIAFIIFLFK